ncbi:MAG: class 1 fructose-bisphosphatase [Thalassotalea sp.]
MKRLIPVLQKDNTPTELILLIRTVLEACKEISFRVSQGQLADVLGSTTDENIQGETQKKLDVISNQLLKDILLEEGSVKAIASEEEDDIVAGHENGQYIVAFDPLDGSSNIDINGQIGTIFTIYPARNDIAASDERQFAQQGSQQVCAGYVLYGPSTLLVMTTGGPTRGYTLDSTQGSFVLTHPELTVVPECAEFAINMSNENFWHSPSKQYIRDVVAGKSGPMAKQYNMRWNAAMVGDVHRVLSRGGIFLYPSDTREGTKNGKLRLLYEANPMALLIEQAGGKAFADQERILDIQPQSLHQRVPVALGSSVEVDTYLSYLS